MVNKASYVSLHRNSSHSIFSLLYRNTHVHTISRFCWTKNKTKNAIFGKFYPPDYYTTTKILLFISFILTSSKLVLPTPRAPSTAALSEPRYHGVSLLPSIRYAEYHLFCICICSIAANESICETPDPLKAFRWAGDVGRPVVFILEIYDKQQQQQTVNLIKLKSHFVRVHFFYSIIL